MLLARLPKTGFNHTMQGERLILIETWLNNSAISLDGLTNFRADRIHVLSGKSRGVGS